MGIPTQGILDRVPLSTDKLNADRAAIHTAQKEPKDLSAADAAKVDALLVDPDIVIPPMIKQTALESVADKIGGDPDAPLKIIEHGGLRISATKDMITVLDLYQGTDQAHIHDGRKAEPERVIPPLSARTLAEMEAGRKRLAEHSASYRPPAPVDTSVGVNVHRPADFVEYQPMTKPAKSKDIK